MIIEKLSLQQFVLIVEFALTTFALFVYKFFQIGLTPCKAEQLLQPIQLQGKKRRKTWKACRKTVSKELRVKGAY